VTWGRIAVVALGLLLVSGSSGAAEKTGISWHPSKPRLGDVAWIHVQDVAEIATVEGSVLRLRPKLMTVTVVMASLIPIMWSTGVGSDIMKPIAAPIIGGMITSTIHVLVITPVIFYIMKLRALRKGTLKMSGMAL